MCAHRSLLPKQRTLTEDENASTVEAWMESMVFHISLEDKTARFLPSGDLATWTAAADRGFVDDPEQYTPAGSKMNKAAKAALLNVVLGSVAGYAPVINGPFVKKHSTSLESIWDRVRAHYGFRRTGSRILELMEFSLEQNESREALWERRYSFMGDNLLTARGDVLHEGVKQERDEVFTPTLLNVLVTLWLKFINPALPALVRQRFCTQLKSSTVYSIREEISESIPTLLAEVEQREGVVCRSGSYQRAGSYQKGRAFKNKSSSYQKPKSLKCCLCEAAGRSSSDHFLSSCPFLPSDDRKYMSRSREVAVFEEEEYDDDDDDGDEEEKNVGAPSRRVNAVSKKLALSVVNSSDSNAVLRRVDIVSSMILIVNLSSKQSRWTIDSGATSNLITVNECKRLNIPIRSTNQRATQADGFTPLPTYGEVHFTARKGHHEISFNGLVVKDLDSPCMAGMPFLRQNKVRIDYGNDTLEIAGCCTFKPDISKSSERAAVLRVSNQTCVLPGESAKFKIPETLLDCTSVAVEPRSTVPANMPDWFNCGIVSPDEEGFISIENTSSEPVLLGKHAQVVQARRVKHADKSDHMSNSSMPTSHMQGSSQHQNAVTKNNQSKLPITSDSIPLNSIQIDPSNILTKPVQAMFHKLHRKYDTVFSGGVGCYNGYYGKFHHVINVGDKLPKQHRGRIVKYNVEDTQRLQQKFDELHAAGVLARAEDIGVPVEYVHPSFLVKKSNGDYRMVTSFGEVAEYARPQPTITSNTEHVLHQIGQWRFVIKTDLKSAYYQILLHLLSCKYVGIMSPFKGTYVYLRSVMGLPGSEAALEEVLSRVFGDLIQEGKMIKLADDLYLGSHDIDDLLATWEEVLKRLELSGLKLSPDKTICCPTHTTILGWEWNQGKISPSSHRLNALAACEPPVAVKGLRSFVGCF